MQRELLAIYGPKLKANVAKIPHHGGESIEPFVQAIRPERAILSAGPNPYGLPKEEVLEMYRRTGAHLHRTDLEGTITITSDGRLGLSSPSGSGMKSSNGSCQIGSSTFEISSLIGSEGLLGFYYRLVPIRGHFRLDLFPERLVFL
ncbi:MAG: hypothetical protein MCM46_17570 [Candidatus Manganitrophus sp. SB1]|nr:hypothetical protein [Candidatus Manganitrophus morganii]